MDNGYDWLNDFYPYPTSTRRCRKIGVRVWIEPIPDLSDRLMFRMAVRNSNVDNIRVFDNLHGIVDFTQWFSTKRQ